jgi:hypothetical protein
LFGGDPLLERLWTELWISLELAKAGFDAIFAPSFSIYDDRPRALHLGQIQRSIEVYATLRELDAPIIPRLGFAGEREVERLAAWCNEHGSKAAAVDWMTFRSDRSWLEQLCLLAKFDESTGARIQLVVNGVVVARRLRALFRAIDPGRLTLTDATYASPIADPRNRGGPRRSSAFELRCAARMKRIDAAQAAVNRRPGGRARLAVDQVAARASRPEPQIMRT